MFDLHKNPRPYSYAPHVKFHIQNSNDVDGVAMCGGIFPVERYAVFSASFVYSMDERNQCQCCVAELHRNASAEVARA